MTDFTVKLFNFRAIVKPSSAGNGEQPGSAPADAPIKFARIAVQRSGSKVHVEALRPAAVPTDGRVAWDDESAFIQCHFSDSGLLNPTVKPKEASVAFHYTCRDVAGEWRRRRFEPENDWDSVQGTIDLSEAVRQIAPSASKAKERMQESALTRAASGSPPGSPLTPNGAAPCPFTPDNVDPDSAEVQLAVNISVAQKKIPVVLKMSTRLCPEATLAMDTVLSTLAATAAAIGADQRKQYPVATAFFMELLDQLCAVIRRSNQCPPSMIPSMVTQVRAFADKFSSPLDRLSYDRGADYVVVCRVMHDWTEYITPDTEKASGSVAPKAFDRPRAAAGRQELDDRAPVVATLKGAVAAGQSMHDDVVALVGQLPAPPTSATCSTYTPEDGAVMQAAHTALLGAGEVMAAIGTALPIIKPLVSLALKIYSMVGKRSELLRSGRELVSHCGLIVSVLQQKPVRDVILVDDSSRALMYIVLGKMEAAAHVLASVEQMNYVMQVLSASGRIGEVDRLAKEISTCLARLHETVSLRDAAAQAVFRESVTRQLVDLQQANAAFTQQMTDQLGRLTAYFGLFTGCTTLEAEERHRLEWAESSEFGHCVTRHESDLIVLRLREHQRRQLVLTLVAAEESDARRRLEASEATATAEHCALRLLLWTQCHRFLDAQSNLQHQECDDRDRILHQASRAHAMLALDHADFVFRSDLASEWTAWCADVSSDMEEVRTTTMDSWDASVFARLNEYNAWKYKFMPFFLGELNRHEADELGNFAQHYTPIAATTANTSASSSTLRFDSVEAAWNKLEDTSSAAASGDGQPVYRRLLVEAPAGSGKSTVVKWLARNATTLTNPTTKGTMRCVLLADLKKVEATLLAMTSRHSGAGTLHVDWIDAVVQSVLVGVDHAPFSDRELELVCESLRRHMSDVLFVFDGFDEVQGTSCRAMQRLLVHIGTAGRVDISPRAGESIVGHVLVTTRTERVLTLCGEALFGVFDKLRLLPWDAASMLQYAEHFPWPSERAEEMVAASTQLLSSTAFSVFDGLPLMVHVVCCTVHPTAMRRHARRMRLSEDSATVRATSLTPTECLNRLVRSMFEWPSRRRLLEIEGLTAEGLEKQLDAEYPKADQLYVELVPWLESVAFEASRSGVIKLTPAEFEQLQQSSLLYVIDGASKSNGYVGSYQFLHKAIGEYLTARFITFRMGVSELAGHFNDDTRLQETTVLTFIAELVATGADQTRREAVVHAVAAAVAVRLERAHNAGSGLTRDRLLEMSSDERRAIAVSSGLESYITFAHSLGAPERAACRKVNSGGREVTNPDPVMKDLLMRLPGAGNRLTLAKFSPLTSTISSTLAWYLPLLLECGPRCGNAYCIRYAVRYGGLKAYGRVSAAASLGRSREAALLAVIEAETGYRPRFADAVALGSASALARLASEAVWDASVGSFVQTTTREAIQLGKSATSLYGRGLRAVYHALRHEFLLHPERCRMLRSDDMIEMLLPWLSDTDIRSSSAAASTAADIMEALRILVLGLTERELHLDAVNVSGSPLFDLRLKMEAFAFALTEDEAVDFAFDIAGARCLTHQRATPTLLITALATTAACFGLTYAELLVRLLDKRCNMRCYDDIRLSASWRLLTLKLLEVLQAPTNFLDEVKTMEWPLADLHADSPGVGWTTFPRGPRLTSVTILYACIDLTKTTPPLSERIRHVDLTGCELKSFDMALLKGCETVTLANVIVESNVQLDFSSLAKVSSLDLRAAIGVEELLGIESCVHLTKLNLSGVQLRAYEQLTLCKQLTELEMINTRMPPHFTARMLAANSGFTKLALGPQSCNDDVLAGASLRDVTYLDVSRSPVTDRSLELLAKRCPRLRSLIVSTTRVTDAGTIQIITACKELERLDVASTNGFVTDKTLRAIAQHLPHFKHLDVEFTAGGVTDKGVVAVAKACRELEYISLSNLDCPGFEPLTSASLTTVAEHCRQLRTLKVAADRKDALLTDDVLTTVARLCPRLKELVMVNARDVTDVSMLQVATGCPQLESLECSNSSNISANAIARIQKMCTRLVRLHAPQARLDAPRTDRLEALKTSCHVVFDGPSAGRHLKFFALQTAAGCQMKNNASLPRLEMVDLDPQSAESLFAGLPPRCPHLSRVGPKLEARSNGIPPQMLANMRALRLDAQDLIKWLRVTPFLPLDPHPVPFVHLTSVTLPSNGDLISDAEVKELTAACPHLTNVNLNNCRRLTDECLTFLGKLRLQDLSLMSSSITYQGFTTFVSPQRRLIAVNLGGTPAAKTTAPSSPATTISAAVKSLDASAARDAVISLSLEGLERPLRDFFWTPLSSIALLQLSRSSIDNMDLAIVGTGCPVLEVLLLPGCESVGDTGLLAIAMGCSRLRNLDVSGTKVTDRSITKIALMCTGLTVLRAVGTELSDKSVRAFHRSRLRLCSLAPCHRSADPIELSEEAVRQLPPQCLLTWQSSVSASMVGPKEVRDMFASPTMP